MLQTSYASSALLIDQSVTREDKCQLIVRIKKAMNFCQKRARLSWSKSRVAPIQGIRPQSMLYTGSAKPQGRKTRLRPAHLRTSRDTYVTQSQQLSPHFSYLNDTGSDPFITSPSWIQTEFTTTETRLCSLPNR